MANSKYIKGIISDYCVLDTETTGLSAYYDEVIEIGILRVRNDEVVDRYSQLIKPENRIDEFISELTGITNEMVEGMPSILDVKDKVLSFIGDDILIGHNTSYDIRFLSEGFGEQLSNYYMDTLIFSRKLFPELSHHRLSDMASFFNLPQNEHRSLSDCVTTKELYDAIKMTMKEKNLEIKDLWVKKPRKYSNGIHIRDIVPNNVAINENSMFYGKQVVFTGALEKMLRKDAMQIVVNLGGQLSGNVTKKTNYLILGDNSYNAILKGEKSSKHRRAEKLKLEGQDIEIIDEKTFYDILKTEFDDSSKMR